MYPVDELLALYRAYRQGEADAFDRLVAACRPRLGAILRRSHLAAKGSLLNYLKAIADHKILDWIRKSKREKVEFVGEMSNSRSSKRIPSGRRQRKPTLVPASPIISVFPVQA